LLTCVVGVTGKVNVITLLIGKTEVNVTLHTGIGLVLELKDAGQLTVAPLLTLAPPL
jgi:hypothetical protein